MVEHQDKDQAAGLELAESFILCSHQAFRTHIKNIAVFVHKDQNKPKHHKIKKNTFSKIVLDIFCRSKTT